MTTGFVDRLAAARIGGTFNQYADSELRRERLAHYLRERRRARVLLVGEAPGYRGARVSGIPFTSERQLSGTGPAEATATIVRRTLAELGLEDEVAALEPRADASGHRVVEPASDPERDRAVGAVPARARRRAPRTSRSAGSRTPVSAVRMSATRRTAAPPRSGTDSSLRLDRVARWSASRSVATRSCSPRR